jgi:hypothetical protein
VKPSDFNSVILHITKKLQELEDEAAHKGDSFAAGYLDRARRIVGNTAINDIRLVDWNPIQESNILRLHDGVSFRKVSMDAE